LTILVYFKATQSLSFTGLQQPDSWINQYKHSHKAR